MLYNRLPDDLGAVFQECLSDSEIEMIKTAVRQTQVAWINTKSSPSVPSDLIKQQINSFGKLLEKLESL